MQMVSDAWKENQKQSFVNESFIRITLGFNDPEASESAAASDNGSLPIADTAQIVDGLTKTIAPYATLEQNLWVLDGERRILPTSEYGDMGFIGDALSKADGTFDKNPIITIDFSEVFDTQLPGITIGWASAYGEYPVSFKVTAYNGASKVSEILVENNDTADSIAWGNINNYNRITIEILKWCLPYHRARISNIFIGVGREYTKQEITAFKAENEVDPIGSTLHTSNVQFSIDNTSNDYDPNNETGLSQYLMERQEITVKYGFALEDGTVEWEDGGTYYLSQWSAPQNGLVANFTASSLLDFMTATFIKGVYRPDGISLYDLALEILNDANLPLNTDGSHKWFLDDSLKTIMTTAPLPLVSQAECLQYIAQAACCVLFCDRQGNLHIEPINEQVSEDYTISRFNSYSYPEIDLQKPLSYVEIKAYNYFISEDDKGKEIFSGSVEINGERTVTLSYSSPAINAKATVVGGTLTSATYYTNACVLQITGDGSVDISVVGDIVSESTSDYITQNADEGVEQTVSNPLITSPLHALIVGAWVKDWLKNRKKVSGEWRADPRIDPTDKVFVENKFSTNTVRISSVSLSYTGAFKGKFSGRVL